jgi:molybdopterin-guanine dinucleotide biosynthesis protein A
MGFASTEGIIAGVFVGGAGTRMGRCAKGMLEAPGGGTLLERWIGLLSGLGIERVLLVGRHQAYAGFGLEVIDDDPAGIGPMGGLAALLKRSGKGSGASRALALACDMPFVSAGLLARLLAAPDAAVVAPRRGGRWEPLCARYEPERVLPVVARRIAAGAHALQPLLDEAGAVELPLELNDEDELQDWDAPKDVR